MINQYDCNCRDDLKLRCLAGTRSSGDRATDSGSVCRGFESSRVQFIIRGTAKRGMPYDGRPRANGWPKGVFSNIGRSKGINE